MKRVLFAMCCVFIVAGCNSQEKAIAKTHEVPAIEPSLKQQISNTYTQLNDLIQDKRCDTSAQCEVIATGHRACGGPSKYLVFSNKQVSEKEVYRLADKLTRLEKEFNLENKMVSTCQVLPKPGSQCLNNTCILTSGSEVNVQ